MREARKVMQRATQKADGSTISCATAPKDCQGSRPGDQNRARLLPIHLGSMMSSMGFSETIFLFFLALLIFGPKKLPEIARQVGKALNEFKRASNEFKAQIASEIAQLEVENQRQALPPAKQPEGTMATLPPASPEVNHDPAPVPELATEPNAATKAGPDA
jgi:TatA/E family protein of Tat protein translocase